MTSNQSRLQLDLPQTCEEKAVDQFLDPSCAVAAYYLFKTLETTKEAM
jgi:hypothetical protein